MNKRSAMLMAAGLVLTLIVGGVAMSTGLAGPTRPRLLPRRASPEGPQAIIKTVKHTVKVHKPARPATADRDRASHLGFELCRFAVRVRWMTTRG